jgi:uncharacterized damage-inducible protein DinB
MDRETLLNQLALVDYVLTQNLEGISHEASLKQPAEGGNNFNWIMGHVVRSRNQAIQLLGVPSSIDESKYEVYNDQPLADPSKAVRFEDIVVSFKAMQPRFIEGLQNLSAEDAAKPAPFSPAGNPHETIGSLLGAFVFHETYHVGQTGVLRRITGKEGVLKAPKAGSTA